MCTTFASRRSSLSRLASRAGIAKASLSVLESGEGNPTLRLVASLAAELDVEVCELRCENWHHGNGDEVT